MHIHMLQEMWSTQPRDLNLEYLCYVSLCVHKSKSEITNEQYRTSFNAYNNAYNTLKEG